MQEFNASDIRTDMAEVKKKKYYSFEKVRTGRDCSQIRFNCKIQLQIRCDLDAI